MDSSVEGQVKKILLFTIRGVAAGKVSHDETGQKKIAKTPRRQKNNKSPQM